MRKCPHCGQDIQDEAVFCRFCRKSVEPPLWLTSLQKCPYCAEWIERGLETCPLCGKVVPVEPEDISAPPFTEAPAESRLRSVLHSTMSSSSSGRSLEPPLQEPEPPPVEPAVKPASHERKRSDVQAPELGLSSFRSREIGKRKSDQPRIDGELLSSIDPEPIKSKKERKPFNIKPFLYIAGSLILVTALVLLALGPGRAFLEAAFSPDEPSNPPAAGATTAASEGAVPASTAEATAAISNPPGETICIPWSEVTLENEGEQLCVYGNLRRWFEVNDYPFVALFSETQGTFYIVDSVSSHNGVQPGTCIMAEGTVEIMRGVRPFIDAAGNLQDCPGTP